MSPMLKLVPGSAGSHGAPESVSGQGRPHCQLACQGSDHCGCQPGGRKLRVRSSVMGYPTAFVERCLHVLAPPSTPAGPWSELLLLAWGPRGRACPEVHHLSGGSSSADVRVPPPPLCSPSRTVGENLRASQALLSNFDLIFVARDSRPHRATDSPPSRGVPGGAPSLLASSRHLAASLQ